MTKTLLLADDSVTIQKVVGISFASEDVTLITVDNGDDAILRAREIRPDAILADVVMPGKNGYEVCEAIKADPELRHIPVMLLTGTFEAYDEARAQNAGACGHVSKPFEAQTLVEEVNRLLRSDPSGATGGEAVDPAGISLGGSTAEDPAGMSFEFLDEELDEDLGDSTSIDSGGQTRLIGPEDIDPLALDDSATDVVTSATGSASIPMAERTIAMMPPDAIPAPVELETDVLDFELDPDAAEIGDAPAELLTPDPAPLSGGARAAVTGATAPGGAASSLDLNFDFDSPSPDIDPVTGGPDDLAEATILDPVGASGFDVSSSDLGNALDPQPGSPIDAPPDSFEPAPAPLEPPPVPQPSPEPAREPAPPAPQVVAAPPPIPSDPVAQPAASLDADLLAEIAPRLREQLHDTLEKIAWESFSDVTEKIVRQALERVETIAWEVIPHLAETLVRDEIRRMKGESEES